MVSIFFLDLSTLKKTKDLSEEFEHLAHPLEHLEENK
jgi:hypothetical protein